MKKTDEERAAFNEAADKRITRVIHKAGLLPKPREGTKNITIDKGWSPTRQEIRNIAERLAAGERPTGFLHTLTPEQKAKALANKDDPNFP